MPEITASCYECLTTWWTWAPPAIIFLFPHAIAKLPAGWDKKVGLVGAALQVLAGNHSNARNVAPGSVTALLDPASVGAVGRLQAEEAKKE